MSDNIYPIHYVKKSTLRVLRQVFAEYPEIEKAMLFGSLALENFTEPASHEIMLWGSEIDSELSKELRDHINYLDIPDSVQISVRAELDDDEDDLTDILVHIMKTGILVYQKKPPVDKASRQRKQ